MNKNKVLGVALMVSIIIGIISTYSLGVTSIQYAISGYAEFGAYLAGLCVILFGSLAALTLDNA
jgi:hypothetical protein